MPVAVFDQELSEVQGAKSRQGKTKGRRSRKGRRALGRELWRVWAGVQPHPSLWLPAASKLLVTMTLIEKTTESCYAIGSQKVESCAYEVIFML